MLGEIPPACQNLCRAKSYGEVLIVSGWWFAPTPHYGKSLMRVSEVVMGQWRIPKPKPLPVPKPAKPKPRKSPDADSFKKPKRKRPFNKPKADELS